MLKFSSSHTHIPKGVQHPPSWYLPLFRHILAKSWQWQHKPSPAADTLMRMWPRMQLGCECDMSRTAVRSGHNYVQLRGFELEARAPISVNIHSDPVSSLNCWGAIHIFVSGKSKIRSKVDFNIAFLYEYFSLKPFTGTQIDLTLQFPISVDDISVKSFTKDNFSHI